MGKNLCCGKLKITTDPPETRTIFVKCPKCKRGFYLAPKLIDGKAVYTMPTPHKEKHWWGKLSAEALEELKGLKND